MENEREHEIIRHLRGIQKIVINKQHGGFGLSQQAIERYLKIKGVACWPEQNQQVGSLLGPTYWLVAPELRVNQPTAEVWHNMSIAQRQTHNQIYSLQVFSDRDLDRDDPVLVQVVEELGEDADSRFASLKVVEIPASVEWQIEEYDGLEWIAEKHRTWS
jgi:hypothetical protein